jgi:hypothetical protein
VDQVPLEFGGPAKHTLEKIGAKVVYIKQPKVDQSRRQAHADSPQKVTSGICFKATPFTSKNGVINPEKPATVRMQQKLKKMLKEST